MTPTEVLLRIAPRLTVRLYAVAARAGLLGSFAASEGQRLIERSGVQRDQSAYLGATPRAGRPHPAYVSDFVFVPADGL